MTLTQIRFAALLLVLAGVGAEASTAVAVHAAHKVRPLPSVIPAWAQLPSPIALRAVRNEFEMFQVVVDAGAAPISDFEMSITLSGGNGIILGKDIRIYELKKVRFSQASNHEGAEQDGCDDQNGETACDWYDKPNLLDGHHAVANFDGTNWTETQDTRNFPPKFDIGVGERRVFLVEIFAAQTLKPGRYTGDLTFTVTSGTPPPSLPVQLDVENLAPIPLTSSLPTIVRLNADALCRAHHFDDANGFCADGGNTNKLMRRFVRLYARMLLDHRISASLADPVPAGQTPSAMTYGTSYDSLIRGDDPLVMLRSGPTAARLTCVNLPWWLEESGTKIPENDTRHAAWKDYIDARPNFIPKWIDWQSDIDEPGHPMHGLNWWKNLKRHGDLNNADFRPRLKVLLTGDWVQVHNDPNAQAAGVTEDDFQIYSPVLDHLDSSDPQSVYRDDQMPTYFGFRTTGGEVWGYQSCDQHSCGTYWQDPANADRTVDWPSLMADATGTQNRAEPWLHYLYKLKGMLYYQVALKTDRADIPNGLFDAHLPFAGNFDGDGDGTLVYADPPGTGSRPAGSHAAQASYRLKLLRDGMEDFELLKRCEAATTRTTAVNTVKTVFKSSSGSLGNDGAMFSVNSYSRNHGGQNTWSLSSEEEFVGAMDAARASLLSCIGSVRVSHIPGWSESPGGISAPVISGPVLACPEGTTGDLMVRVEGVVPGSEVFLYQGYPGTTGTLLWNGVTDLSYALITLPAGTHSVTPCAGGPLVTCPDSTILYAYQVDANGDQSHLADVAVYSHRFPVPAPTIGVQPSYECAVGTVSSGLVSGAKATWEQGDSQANASLLLGPYSVYKNDSWVMVPFQSPLDELSAVPGNKVFATQSYCQQSASRAQPVESYPGSLPKPNVGTCTGTSFDGSSCLEVSNLVPGATVVIYDELNNVISSGPAFFSIQWFQVNATKVHAQQLLCAGSESPKSEIIDLPPGLECADLPAPTFKRPKVGDEEIELETWINGARFNVIAVRLGTGEEIGDGTFPIVRLTRPIAASDRVIRVFQSVGNCRGEWTYEIEPIAD